MSEKIQNAISSIDKEIVDLESIKERSIISGEFVKRMLEAYEDGICPICNQRVNDDFKGHLKMKMHDLSGFEGLNEEQKSKLIKLHSRKVQLQHLNSVSMKEKVVALESIISDIIVEKSDLEQKLRELNERVSEVGGSEKIEKIVRAFSKCNEKIINTDKGIQTEKERIEKIKIDIKGLVDKIAHFSKGDEIQKAERRRNECFRIKRLLELSIEEYRQELKMKVENDASKIFVGISNQKQYVGLVINENFGLSIMNNSGQIVEIRSAGYEHIVALSLIGALHKNAPLQGPIIMDSPFGRLDPDHKTKITNSLPGLANQVVLLLYRNEVDENEARSILGSSLINEYKLKPTTATFTEIEAN